MDLSLSMSNISRRQDITISQSGNDAQLLSLGFNDNILDGIEVGRDLFQHGAQSDLQLADLGLDDMNEIEMGRDAAFERSLTMDDIGAPLERMNIKDANNNEEFDFDLGPEPDFLPEASPDVRQHDSSFDLPDASMTTESNSGKENVPAYSLPVIIETHSRNLFLSTCSAHCRYTSHWR